MLASGVQGRDNSSNHNFPHVFGEEEEEGELTGPRKEETQHMFCQRRFLHRICDSIVHKKTSAPHA